MLASIFPSKWLPHSLKCISSMTFACSVSLTHLKLSKAAYLQKSSPPISKYYAAMILNLLRAFIVPSISPTWKYFLMPVTPLSILSHSTCINSSSSVLSWASCMIECSPSPLIQDNKSVSWFWSHGFFYSKIFKLPNLCFYFNYIFLQWFIPNFIVVVNLSYYELQVQVCYNKQSTKSSKKFESY